MKKLLLAALLTLPVTAQTPALQIEVILRTSGDTAQTRAVCRRYALSKGWTAENTVAPCDYAEQQLAQYLLDEIEKHETEEAKRTAEATTRTRNRAELVLKPRP